MTNDVYKRRWHSMANSMNHVYQYNHEDKFLIMFGKDVPRICNYFGVNRATAYRWIKCGKPTTAIGLRLLDIAASGFLPCTDAWDGYMLVNNRIITPNGYDVLPGELDQLCINDERRPTADRVINRSRNFKPWHDREPDFVKEYKKR